jgi:hypothetical protein
MHQRLVQQMDRFVWQALNPGASNMIDKIFGPLNRVHNAHRFARRDQEYGQVRNQRNACFSRRIQGVGVETGRRRAGHMPRLTRLSALVASSPCGGVRDASVSFCYAGRTVRGARSARRVICAPLSEAGASSQGAINGRTLGAQLEELTSAPTPVPRRHKARPRSSQGRAGF